MEVSIGRLRLMARVVGPTGRGGRADAERLLTGEAARRRMLDVLTSAFDGEEVLVIRSLACRSVLRADAATGVDTLARSIASSASRLVRDHPANDDWVVRFADEATYVAAYIHDCLDGQHHRWYFNAFATYRRSGGSTDWSALLAAHRDRRWRILAQVRRNGDLEPLLTALGDDGAAGLVDDFAAGDAADWAPLVATASEIVGRASGAGRPTRAPDRPTAPAATRPPPDWRDPANLGDAIAWVAADLLSTSATASAGGRPDVELASVTEAARRHEWFDHDAFEAGLSARRAEDGGPGPSQAVPAGAAPPQLSPRARRALADLSEAVGDPQLFLDARHPGSSANLIRLVAALVQHAPQWHDDDLARSLTAHVLRLWELAMTGGHRAAPAGPGTGLERLAATHAPTAGAPGPGADAQPPAATPSTPARPPSDRVGGHDRGEPPGPARGGVEPVPATPRPGPTPASVVALLAARFPGAGERDPGRRSQAACGLLLLRALLDLGLTAYLLDPVHDDGEPLLSALLRRWAGQPPDQAGDPLLELVAELAGRRPGPAHRLEEACDLAVQRELGQRLAALPLRTVAVPYAADEVATVVVDAAARVLPLGWLRGRPGLDGSVGAVASSLALEPEPAGADAQASVADGLAAVATGGHGHDDPQADLLIDLLAVSGVQVWARWLPGFSDARVPYLLSTLVRRPADLEIGSSEIVVRLPPRSHDIVLELAGYLEPLEAGPALGGRRVRFVSGNQHGH
jgi:hypothetical protein